MYWMRRIRRHILLALLSAMLGTGIFFLLSSPDPLFKTSMASAYASWVLLSATLILGPWNVLRNRPNPVSTDLRRDLGIWAGLIGLFHVIVGLQVHWKGRFWVYFVFASEEHHFFPVRYDPFGFANYTGLGAALVLLLLLALSNDLALRRFGAKRWKSLQRWNYTCSIFVVLHGIAYQFIEKRNLPFVTLFISIAIIPAIMQMAGFRSRRAQKASAMLGKAPSI